MSIESVHNSCVDAFRTSNFCSAYTFDFGRACRAFRSHFQYHVDLGSHEMSTTSSPKLPASNEAPSSRSSLSSERPAPANQRSNRTALRDYYSLKSDDSSNRVEAEPSLIQDEIEVVSELDKAGFDADKFVQELLVTEGLEKILKIEAGLLSDVRNLDGERKALVYDNYSKLISATDTIKKMRTDMDPLVPMTSSLAPTIAHIAETSASLSENLKKNGVVVESTEQFENVEKLDARALAAKQRRTVSWVLDTPSRLRSLVEAGKSDEAKIQWEVVRPLLQKWSNVKGTDDVRRGCEECFPG